MLTNPLLVIAATAGFIGQYAAAAGPAPRYELVDLTTEVGDFQGQATDINDNGEIVGWGDQGWQRWDLVGDTWVTTPLDFDPAEIPFCYWVDEVWSINNHGAVVGAAFCQHLENEALQWELGETLAQPIVDFSIADDINDRGQVVGYGTTPTRGAWVWEAGLRTDLDDYPAQALGINELGQIVGRTSLFRAVLWLPSGDPFVWKPIDLGTLGGEHSEANDINESSEIVGTSELGDATTWHAFLWQEGLLTNLGDLPGLGNTNALAINDAGQIVGWALTADFKMWRAFLWQDGTIYDLNDMVLAGPLIELRGAFGINDHGQIVGWSKTTEGKFHAFLLNPLAPGDLDGDGTVDGTDLVALLRAWGPCADCSEPLACLPDLDGDCRVATSDLLTLLGHWGD